MLTQASHPFKKPNKIMGRVLTLFWKTVVAVLRPCELLSMKDLLHMMKKWKQACKQPRKGEKVFWLELDLVEMFPRIPRHAILPALKALVDRVQEKKSTKGPIHFWISKAGSRRADSCQIGNTVSFWEMNTVDMFHFVKFDLECNTKFVCLSSVLNQLAGVPIGGSASAQLACLTLVMRELEMARPIPGTPHVRYRDNFLTRIVVRRSKNAPTWEMAVQRKAAQVQQAVKKITGMDVTIEQYGPEINFLEARLRPLHSDDYIRLKSVTVHAQPGDSTPGQFTKMLSPTAPNAQPTTKSMTPNMARHAQHYRSTLVGATANLGQVGGVLHCKGYPSSDWEPTLRAHAKRWDIPLPAQWSPLPLGPCSQILVEYLAHTGRE